MSESLADDYAWEAGFRWGYKGTGEKPARAPSAAFDAGEREGRCLRALSAAIRASYETELDRIPGAGAARVGKALAFYKPINPTS